MTESKNSEIVDVNIFPILINIQVFSIFLFKFGIISFRAVPRIIEVFSDFLRIPLKKYHFTSVINWSLKLGLYKLKSAKQLSEDWTAIIDASIKLGKKKILLVLRVPTRIMIKRVKALDFNDIEVVGLYVQESLTGEIIADLVKPLFSKLSNPNQILTDGAGDLEKSIKIIFNTTESKCFHSLDIGHFSANVLKKAYINNEQFIKFLEFTSRVSSKLNQTIAAWICPNKLPIKARFQGISDIAKWSEKAFEYFKNHIDDCETETKKLLIANFQGYEFLVKFAKKFNKDCQLINELSKIVKNKGLSEFTFIEAMKVLSKLSPKSQIRIPLENYLRTNMKQFRENEVETGLLSSDIIESVFGKIKYIMKNSPSKEINKLSLLIPGLVGEFNEELIINAIREIKIKDIKNWEEENVKNTILKKRRKEFSKIKPKKDVPKHAEYTTPLVA